jgi:hypothetical protein
LKSYGENHALALSKSSAKIGGRLGHFLARFNQYHFLTQGLRTLEQSLDTFNPFVVGSIPAQPTNMMSCEVAGRLKKPHG